MAHFGQGIKQKKTVPVGVKEVVDFFARRMVQNQTFKICDKISKVKNVDLAEGSTFTGEALVVGNYCMPNGYGVKIYKSENNKRIVSFLEVEESDVLLICHILNIICILVE